MDSRLSVAGGTLLANVATAFAAQPIGDVDPVAELVHNAVALVGTIVVIAVAAHRLRVAGPPATTHGSPSTRPARPGQPVSVHGARRSYRNRSRTCWLTNRPFESAARKPAMTAVGTSK